MGAATALEIEWHEDGTYTAKGWLDLDRILDGMMGASLVSMLDGAAFKAIWRVRHGDGKVYHVLIPRPGGEGFPLPSRQPPRGV